MPDDSVPDDSVPDISSGFDPVRDVRLDHARLRALAHPLRVRMLGELRNHGPATASRLARVLGESSGATSYHLRQLLAHGFVAEDTDRGTRRERWWRAVHRQTWFDMTLDDTNREAGGVYLRAVARNYSERMLAYVDGIETEADDYGAEWADVSTISDWLLHLPPARAADLHRELFEVLSRYRQESDEAQRSPTVGADTGALVVQLQLFPLARSDR